MIEQVGKAGRLRHSEKRQSLKHAATYQAVNGIAMPWLFFTWILQSEISLFFTLLSLSLCTSCRPVSLSLAECGLPPAAFTLLFPFTYTNRTDILQTLLPLSRHHALNHCLIFNYHFRVSSLITMIDSSRLWL